jgi:hypothetical protein
MSHERGLSTAGQTHDTKDLSTMDFQIDASDRRHAIKSLESLGLGEAFALNRLKAFFGAWAKDLPNASAFNGLVGGAVLCQLARSARLLQRLNQHWTADTKVTLWRP